MNLENLMLRKDLVFRFGDKNDGVIGIPCITKDNQVIEASYFYGKEKQKNIIVVSSQINCPMRCLFCELGADKFTRNLIPEEIYDQVGLILNEAKKEGFCLDKDPHKITIANTGEPLLNENIIEVVEELTRLNTSFKVSTVFPKSRGVTERIESLAHLASRYHQSIQLQISLISTSEDERQRIAGARVANFKMIRDTAELWRAINPNGRKINLSLILTSEMDCDVGKISSIFPSEMFRFRFREYVPTKNGSDNGLDRVSLERITEIKDRFLEKGYEITHFASPTEVERKFNLASNRIRRIYLDMINK